MKKDIRKMPGYEVATTRYDDPITFITSIQSGEIKEYLSILYLAEKGAQESWDKIEQRIIQQGGRQSDENVKQRRARSIESIQENTRRALYLAAYGFIESSIVDWITTLLEDSHKVKLRDLGGKGLQKCATYLAKVAELDLPCGLIGSQAFEFLNYLRNVIAHSGGVPNDIDKFIRLYQSSGLPRDFLMSTRPLRLGADSVKYIVEEGAHTIEEFGKKALGAGYRAGGKKRARVHSRRKHE